MVTSVMSSKGRVTIPLRVRTALHITTGSKIEFVEIENGKFAIIAATASVTALKGILKTPQKPVTLDGMAHAIETQGVE